MGENWTPAGDECRTRKLVTHGVFRWCRRAAVGTLLATLNWLIAWCVFGFALVTLRCVKTEERVLVELFGGQYLDYCFDREMRPRTSFRQLLE